MAEQLRQDVVNGIGVALASVGCVLESAFELGVGEIVEIPRPDRVHSFERLDDFRQRRPFRKQRRGKRHRARHSGQPHHAACHDVRRQVERAGYTAAFTTHAAPWTAGSDRLLIPRVNIWEGSAVGASGRFSRPMLEYTLFWKPWRTAKAAREGVRGLAAAVSESVPG